MVTENTKRYQKLRRSLIKFFGSKCVRCGRKPQYKHFHFAHLIPTDVVGMGRGSWVRLKDVCKNPDCYVLLCRTCHDVFDHRTSSK